MTTAFIKILLATDKAPKPELKYSIVSAGPYSGAYLEYRLFNGYKCPTGRFARKATGDDPLLKLDTILSPVTMEKELVVIVDCKKGENLVTCSTEPPY